MSRGGATPRGSPRIAYGDRWLEDFLPPEVLETGRLLPLRPPVAVPPLADVAGALVDSLERSATPELVPSLREWIGRPYAGGGVVVIVDDYTRPCAHQRQLLPGLLAWLATQGVKREAIEMIIATATHRDPRPDEYPHMFGEVWPAWRDRIVPHPDGEDLVRLGTMPDGTPIELNGRAARARIIVSLSDLDYHYFAGVSGGPKHLVPGIAGRALTTADHLRMFGPRGFAQNVEMGVLEGNPVYEFKRVAVQQILAALAERSTFVYGVVSVLNPHGQIVALEGGDLITLHRKLRHVLDEVYVAEIPRLADVAIVAAKHLGLNVYQAGKAINAAARAVRSGGTIVCVAPCSDGFGNDEFRNLMGLAAPILHGAEAKIGGGSDPTNEGNAAIDAALEAVQAAVVKDFRIGKQKPVDLLVRYRHTGWGNLCLLADGLTDADRALLPFRYVGTSGEDPGRRLREWVAARERDSAATYVVIDDPTYLVRVRG